MEQEEIVLPEKLVAARLIYLSLSLCGATFALPFILTHPQLLLGAFVNALLLVAASFLPFSLATPVALMPSLGALSRGILFGPLTPLLYYLIPIIWLGNIALILVFKKVNPRYGYFWALILAAAVKTCLLFFPAFLLVKIKLLPPLFLTTMGSFQFLTALSGGILLFTLFKIAKKFSL